MNKKLPSWSLLGIIAGCLSAVVLAVWAISATTTLTKQSWLMYEHPYQVKGQAQIVRTRLSEAQLFLPTLLRLAGETPLKSKDMLTSRDSVIDESVQIIKTLYLGPRQDLADMDDLIRQIRQLRLEAVDFCSNLTTQEEVDQYFAQELEPYYIAVDAVLLRIATFADNKVESICIAAEQVQRNATIGFSFLGGFILLMAITSSMSHQRRTAEVIYRKQLFDLLSNSIDDVFFIFDYEKWQMEYVSENSQKIIGVESAAFYQDPAYMRKGLCPDSVERYDQMFRNGPLQHEAECDVRYLQGHTWMELKIRTHPIFVKNKLNRYVIVLYDQTKMIEHQNSMRDALLGAQMANNAKREFLSRMSHEIRTPMNTIIGMTAIATRHINDMSHIENCLRKITYSSSHLLSLINDILDMSKIEDSKLTLNHEAFDFRQLIESITSIAYPQAVERKQSFEVSITGLHEEQLVGDMLRLNQILLNLLSNAIKFTPDNGSVRLEISKLQVKNKQIRLRFVVRDTGIGMGEEFMGRLYKPFEQADSSIAQKYGGTGLGMSITKNLVALMNGTISVDSKLGEGTAFTLELPFELTGQDLPVSCPEFSSLKVLVVDDDQSTCDHAMVLLEQMYIQASWVCNGRDAVTKVVEAHETGNDYDVCFIDWCMPDMDGVETAKNIRKHVGPDTLIIIISAYDWSVIEHDARAAGVNAFISKPIFISSLYNTLHAIVFPKTLKSAIDSSKESRYSFMGKKVLLAEDNYINQEIAIILLNEVDLIVDCAENGEEALNLFQKSKENEYAIILMDVQMPIMNGYEAVRAIRACEHVAAKDIPIIAMTANAFHEDVVAAKDAGMNGHIAKPIDVDILYKTISEYIC